jgi:hypothetical protein
MPRILRLFSRNGGIFGRNGGIIPVEKSHAYDHYIYRPGGPLNITGTDIPRLRPVQLGPRAVGGIEDEAVAIVEALRAARDAKTAA